MSIHCPKCSQESIVKKNITEKFTLWKCETQGCGMSVPIEYFNVVFTEDEVGILLDDYKQNFAVPKEKREGIIKKEVKFPKGDGEVELFLFSEPDFKNTKYKKYSIQFSANKKTPTEGINQSM